MAAQCPPGVDCSADLGPSAAPIVTPVFVLAILAVAARLYCRHITGHNGTASDYTIIIGFVFSAALTSMVLYSPRIGMGKHVEVVPMDQLESLLISLYVGCVLYAIAIAVIKISILLLYRSLFPTPGINLATKIIGLISILWGIETALVGIFSCSPVQAYWDLSITQKTCINTAAFFIANSALHVVIDVSILTVPVRKVWALKMSLQNKLIVSFMFLLGGFICVIGIIRLFFLATLNSQDPSYSLFDTYIWSSIETNVGVICACLPTLRPLFMKLFPKGGFGSTTVAPSPGYFEYGTDSNVHRSRNARHPNDFERLRDCHMGNMSPAVNSKTAIVITHDVEMENELGDAGSREEMWSNSFSGGKRG